MIGLEADDVHGVGDGSQESEHQHREGAGVSDESDPGAEPQRREGNKGGDPEPRVPIPATVTDRDATTGRPHEHAESRTMMTNGNPDSAARRLCMGRLRGTVRWPSSLVAG